MNIEKVIRDNIANVKGIGCEVYIAPNIPDKKMNNAISSMAKGVEPEYVLAIVDTTILKSAKEGFVFLGDKIYSKSFVEGCIQIAEIDKIEKKEIKIQKKDGSVENKPVYYLVLTNGETQDITRDFIHTNTTEFISLMNHIVEEVKESDGKLESTNQTCPLSMMSSASKEAYLKLVCNSAYDDDGIVDAGEYAEIMSLIAMNNIEKDVRIVIRSYMFDKSMVEDNESLIHKLEANVDAGSIEALKLSAMKDTLNLLMGKIKEFDWKENEYVCTLKNLLNIEDNQIVYIVENIESNREIIECRQDDVQIKKSMQELAAKAGAVGVPLAAIYLSGSVIGVSAAGMTSGLAALGMGGALGFSSMFTGIGVAVLLGVGAYKGVKKITGMGDLEKNKQRELMLQEIAKNSQKALNYLIEDVNEMAFQLQEALKTSVETEKKIQKISGMLAMLSRGAEKTTNQIGFAEKEKLLCRLPKTIKKDIIEQLAAGATKKAIKELIYSAYTETKTEDLETRQEYVLNTDLDLNTLENVYQALEGIGFYNMVDNSKAMVTNVAKGMVKGIFK